MRPIQTRFGLRAPSLEQAITALASLWGETIVSNGGETQNALRTVYLTSGPDRLLHFGAHQVKLPHGSALATGGRTWNRRHRHPGDFMARSPRGREESGCRGAEALARLACAIDTGQSDAFSRRQ